MKQKINILFYAIIIFSAAIPSCREGIVDPGNSVGNVNEPVVEKNAYAFTFQIDARNITFTRSDETYLDITSTDIAVTLKDYSGGSVHVQVVADNLSTLYDNLLTSEISGKQTSVINHIAQKVRFDFQNFSGKLKVQLTETPKTY